MEKILRDNKVEVISHSRLAFGGRSIKKINWIVDFQHIHLPRMFSWFEIVYRNMLFRRFAQGSDVVVLSSDDAGNDFRKIYPRYAGKAKILKFVSQPDVRIYSMDDIGAIEKKYGFRGKFFYLPNQLWKHKNHRVVLRALDILKRRGEDVLVISSGLMTDYRHKGYKEELMDYIRRKNLEKNILFLGLIDYIDVLALMRHSIAVINPSLFEGWSSTVEEAKSIGKSLILSRIAVHEEQCPPSVEYFDPENERELAEIISEKLKKSSGGPELELEKEAGRRIKERTRQFGATYQKIVLGIRS